MKLTQVVDDYVRLKRSLGFRFRTAENILEAFARHAGPVAIDDVGQEEVARFLRGPRPPVRSTWHTKYSALAGLVRFALQRGLLSLGRHLPARAARRRDLPPGRRALLSDGAEPRRNEPARRRVLPAAPA